MSNEIKIEDDKVCLSDGVVSYTLTKQNLYEAAHNFVNGVNVIRDNNITALHEYLSDKLDADRYELNIAWQRSGDYPYSVSLELVVHTKNGTIKKELEFSDWSDIDIVELLDEVKFDKK